MYVDCGEEKSKELIKFENIAMKAKMGVICGKDKIQGTSSKRCRYWKEVTAKRALPSAPTITLLVTASSTFRKGAAPARGVA